MSNKLTPFLLVASLALCAFNGPPTGSPVQSTLEEPGSYGLFFTSFIGACGGWYRDDDQKLVCCDLDSRPECDDDGDCWCSPDDHCKAYCEPRGTCDEPAPECKSDDDRTGPYGPM